MSEPILDANAGASLLRPWEEERTFHDALYDWMRSAPWLGLSGAAHAILFFVIASFPWSSFTVPDSPEIVATVDPTREEIVEEIDEEPVEDLPEIEPDTKPELVSSDDLEIEDPSPNSDNFDFDAKPDFANPFTHLDAFANPYIGIGGGGAFGLHGGPGGGGRGLGHGEGVQVCIAEALDWLADHQSSDGYWDCDDFMNNCVVGISHADGAGLAQHDVGVTGLATLAFLGRGQTATEGEHKGTVAAALRWLREQQDLDTGLIGKKSSHGFVYDHALASLALIEAYYHNRSPILRRHAQSAVHYIQRARDPYGAWRYDVPSIGDSDTSVTGWMVFALAAAKDAGLEVDEGAFDGALRWIDEATDPATGRVGYDTRGSLSSRTAANEHYPREKSEAMTAVGMLCRIFIAHLDGEDLEDDDLLQRQAELLARTPPEWDPDGFGCDMYSWYYGTYAMYQLGGRRWNAWKAAMEPAVLDSQRDDGDFAGSWDPIGPWGYAGGRVYSTAILALNLEVYFRYSRLMGSR